MNYARVTNLHNDEPAVVKVGAAGFEPAKAYATRFTVWPIWPLWNTPKSMSMQTENSAYRFSNLLSLQELAEGLEPTTTGLQNRSSTN